MIGKSKRVVPSGGRDHSSLLRLLRQHHQSIARPALLEAAGPLQVFHFAIHLHPRFLGERNAQGTRRIQDRALDADGSRFYVLK